MGKPRLTSIPSPPLAPTGYAALLCRPCPCPTELDFPRYKYVVHVVLGEHRGQGVRVASRCLWDTNTDNMCTANFSNEQLWATATVFACYIE